MRLPRREDQTTSTSSRKASVGAVIRDNSGHTTIEDTAETFITSFSEALLICRAIFEGKVEETRPQRIPLYISRRYHDNRKSKNKLILERFF